MPAGGARRCCCRRRCCQCCGRGRGSRRWDPRERRPPRPPGPATARPARDRREPITASGRRPRPPWCPARSPHRTSEFLDVDVTATMALQDQLKGSQEFADVKLTRSRSSREAVLPRRGAPRPQ
ncbi:hypothetical protein HBB16_16925 [Pseudonocardia sp. MCCB 268]|nr:hypothetical protein [Pseudonocardia cytotoxica]